LCAALVEEDAVAGRGSRQRPEGRETVLGLGVAWGLIAGSAVGAVLLAITGDAIWVAVCPGIGLAIGAGITTVLSGPDRGGDAGTGGGHATTEPEGRPGADRGHDPPDGG
jgi:hypothetical protein